jgi:hypothetical protein
MNDLGQELWKLPSRAEELWSLGVPGRVLLCVLVVALISLVGVLPRATNTAWDRRFSGARRLGLPAALMVAALAAFVWSTRIAREQELSFILSDLRNSPTRSMFSSSAWWAHRAAQLTAVYMFVAIPVLLVAALRIFTALTTRTLLISVALLCLATAYGTLGLCGVYGFAIAGLQGCGDPEAQINYMLRDLREAQNLLKFSTRAVTGVGIAGIAACAVVAMGDARRGYAVTRRSSIASALLLLLGVAVFAATRGTAADAQRGVWHLEAVRRCPPETVVATVSIWAYPCAPLIEAPVVVLRDGGHSIDSGPMSPDSELIAALRNKVKLWKEINPRRDFPGNVIVIAPDKTLVRALLLARLHEVGFHRVQLVTGAEPQRLETATIGSFEYRSQCCGIELELDPTAPRFSPDATYEDLLRAAGAEKERRGVLRIAP